MISDVFNPAIHYPKHHCKDRANLESEILDKLDTVPMSEPGPIWKGCVLTLSVLLIKESNSDQKGFFFNGSKDFSEKDYLWRWEEGEINEASPAGLLIAGG